VNSFNLSLGNAVWAALAAANPNSDEIPFLNCAPDCDLMYGENRCRFFNAIEFLVHRDQPCINEVFQILNSLEHSEVS